MSAVSRVPEVRAALLGRQRALAGGRRDRRRRAGHRHGRAAGRRRSSCTSTRPWRSGPRAGSRSGAWTPTGDEAELVREQLRARDAQDRGRAVAPLRAADDAVVIVAPTATASSRRWTSWSRRSPAPSRGAPLATPARAAATRRPPGPRRRRTGAPDVAPAARPAAARDSRSATGSSRRAMRLDNDQTLLVRAGRARLADRRPRCSRTSASRASSGSRARAPSSSPPTTSPTRTRSCSAPGSRPRCAAGGSTGWASGSCSTGRCSAGSRPTAASTPWTAGPRTWRPTAWPRGSSRPATSC